VTEEHLIRLARRRTDRPVPTFAGDPAEPIAADWIMVSEAPEEATHRRAYCLYVLDASGRVTECLQFETLRIAVDQAHEIFGLSDADWRECLLSVPANGPFDVAMLEGTMALAND
jgi:hypothetical protein